MFSTNQIFRVTGTVDQIEKVLRFSFELEGQDKHLTKGEKERGCKTVYQISDDNKSFCVGWGFEEVPPGWKAFDPPFTYIRASKKIKEFIQKFEGLGDHDVYKGCISEIGFLAEDIKENDSYGNIESPYHGIVKFSPYTVIYSR